MGANSAGGAQALQRGFTGDTLEHDLRQFIATSKEHAAMMSERRLASQYGISYGTVRRVVANLVTEGLIYKKPGQGVFVAAKPPKGEQASSSQVLYVDDWAQPGHPYCMRKLQGMMDGADNLGFRMEVKRVDTLWDRAGRHKVLDEVSRPELAGLITSVMTPQLLQEVRMIRPDLPIVTGFAEVTGERVACVLHNQFSFGYQSAQHLCKRGVRSILAVVKHDDWLPGARAALAEQDEDVAIHVVRWDPGEAIDAIVVAITARPDGVIFADDHMARQVLAVLDERVKNQLQVVSAANTGGNELPTWVTRLNMDGYEVGMLSMTLLHALVDGRELSNPVIHAEPRLVAAEPRPDTQ